MRIAYANANYRKNDTRGRNAHIVQFINHAVDLGHEVWSWPGDEHPATHKLPSRQPGFTMALRQMECIYIRIQDRPPGVCRYGLFPYRQLIKSPLIVWEFNTAPEFLRTLGASESDLNRAIQNFRQLSRSCDLAICVSKALAVYVRDKLGIERVVTVPNGSDPDKFRPDIQPFGRVERNPDRLNVVWIGSAELAWHNFELLRDAARILWESGEKFKIAFHVIGRQFGQIREMTPNVHYYGSDDYEAMPRWLSGMDVGLCLYRRGPADYNSPLKLFDYMSSGLAVAGTSQPQVREVFEQLGQLDLLVPANDPAALAGVLRQLERDRQRVRRLGNAGRQLVIETYNWRRAVKSIFDEIEALLKDRH